MTKRWPTIPFGRLLGYSLLLVLPTVLVLDRLVFLQDIIIDHALWVVASAMVSAIAIVWLFLGEMSGMARYTRQIAEGDTSDLPTLTTEATRGIVRQVVQLDGKWRRRVKAFSQSIDADMQILESLADPLILVNSDGIVVRANASARHLFGRSLSDETIDAALNPPELLKAVNTVLELRQPLSLELKWPTPLVRFFDARVMPVETWFADSAIEREESETPPEISVVITLHETTQIHRTAQLREQFIANVSHELRTPLSVISGFLETLQNLGDDDRDSQRRFLGIMNDQAMRMTRLVSDLLSLSRIDQQDQVFGGIVNMRDVVEEVAGAMELQAASRSIAIETDLVGELDVRGDYDQLCQVIQNLTDNGINYGRAGGYVLLSARREAGDIIVSVSDNGEGIAADHIPHLGERFYRVDPARSRARGGSGLGLAIVQGIVQRHGGSMKVESTQGQGSIFSLRLPAAEALQ